jgi:membrane protein DedA with SNARE-associated domain
MSDWVIRLIESAGYVGVFLLMMLETVFPPVPSEVVMPVAGVIAAHGDMTLAGVILSGTAGAMAGNLLWYLVARWVGIRRFHRFIDRHGRWLTMDWYDVERVQQLFGRFGAVVVAIGRLIPTIRSVVSIPAGLVHMQLVKFLFWSTLGTAAWSGLLAAAGYLLGQQFSRIEDVLGPVSSAIVIGIVIFYVYRQITWSKRQLKRADGRSDRRP